MKPSPRDPPRDASMVGEWLSTAAGGGREERWGLDGRENSGVEGVGQYFPGRPSPLDVLMHVENNLTANLLHSFSFLPGSPLRSTCQPATPSRPASRRTYRTLPFVPSATSGAARFLLVSPIEPAATRSSSPRLPFFSFLSRPSAFSLLLSPPPALVSLDSTQPAADLAPNRIRNLNF